MVNGLIQVLLGQLVHRGHNAAAHQRRMQDGVDLVEGQPVFHSALIPCKQHLAEVQIKVDEFTAVPAIVFFCQIQRRFVMADGNQRLNAVLFALGDHIVIELQALFVGRSVIAIRENSAPCHRKAEHLKTHFCKELDVRLIMVVKVNRHQLHVVGGRLCGWFALDAVGHDVLNGQPLAIFVVGTLALICGCCTAPEEVFRELNRFHSNTPLLTYF